ncbi:SDR family NAD(P)-dependent oxidoreductase [Lactobacillus terrae]|uniref:SDR family NAD(P)-dependent oxidoreductase n=1 Tax=Lactobacillus terrae TaxID=2269374 RepID=UPI000C1B78DF|nr:SDR family oxidoreductase [Lactobacillus terrae]
MDLYLENKTALITGSTKGIGKAIATELAREGVNVVINGRSQSGVDAVVNELKKEFPNTTPKGVAADLSKKSDQEKLFETFPKIDILVNNMGIFDQVDYWTLEDEDWKKYFDINVLSGNALAKHYLKNMLDQDFGRIIFIASEEAIMPSGGMAPYSMSKAMNLSLAQNLSQLTVGTHVTVNTILPGPTRTEGVEQMLKDMYQDTDIPEKDWGDHFMKTERSRSQIQRLIKPSEVGRLAAFVSSPSSSSFSGEAIRVEGGLVPTMF